VSYDYGSMPPPSYGGPGTTLPTPTPRNVQRAVWLMYAMVVLGVLSPLQEILDRDGLRAAIRDADKSATPEQVEDRLKAAILIAIVITGIIVVLYLALARQVRAGKGWARTVTLVLTGIGALGALGELLRPNNALHKVVSLLQLIVYVLIIVLLAERSSTAYFRRPRY
jgi:hypothetical protein